MNRYSDSLRKEEMLSQVFFYVSSTQQNLIVKKKSGVIRNEQAVTILFETYIKHVKFICIWH